MRSGVWVTPGCLLVPPSPVWGHGWLLPGSRRKQVFQSKRCHEKSIAIISFFNEKWSHNGCQKLEKCDKDWSGSIDKTGLEHVYMKVRKSVDIHDPEELISRLSPRWNHCFHFCILAQAVPNFVAKRFGD